MNFPNLKLFDEPLSEQHKWISRVTKVTLLHTNAQTSEIKLYAPIYSAWMDVQELSHNPLAEYVNSLSKHFLSLVGYQIHLGSMDVEGNEHYDISYPAFQIPVNKVYHNGKWVKPSKIEETEKEAEKRINRNNKRLAKANKKFDKKQITKP